MLVKQLPPSLTEKKTQKLVNKIRRKIAKGNNTDQLIILTTAVAELISELSDGQPDFLPWACEQLRQAALHGACEHFNENKRTLH